MAQFFPLYGYRYSTAPLEQVLTPPYDVITPEEQQQYYRRHPHNIIRLEYGIQTEKDDLNDNRYTRALSHFKQWKQQGVLQKDSKPCFYLYQQIFMAEGKQYTRTGLLGALKAVPYEQGEVLPHEETLSGPKEDRLQLLRHCQANFSPIFGLYDDPQKSVYNLSALENPPLEQTVDAEGVTHRLWLIDDPREVALVKRTIAPLPVFIADGHHRYETALAYWKESGVTGHDRILICLVNIHDPGLVIFPTHRLVTGIVPETAGSLVDRLPAMFQVLPAHNHEQIGPNTIMLVSPRGKWLIRWDAAQINSPSPRDHLEVAVLEKHILQPLLGIDAENQRLQKNLVYVKDTNLVERNIAEGRGQLGFILPPPRVEQILQVAGAGEKMPQKSTYFYPKMITGLVINDLNESYSG